MHPLLPPLLTVIIYHTERNDNCTFMPENVLFEFQHTFSFNTLYLWQYLTKFRDGANSPHLGCQFTPAVPIRPGMSGNFIFLLIKQKLKYLKSLKCICVELLCISLMHVCYNLLAASMTSLEAIKKRGANSPCSPLLNILNK